MCENVNLFNVDLVNKLAVYNSDLNTKINALGSTDVALDFSNKIQLIEAKPFVVSSNLTELNTFFEKKDKIPADTTTTKSAKKL